MRQIQVLLIDDDEKLGRSLKQYLAKFSIHLFMATLPSVGMKLFSENDIDLILLDGMLPEKDGLEVCRDIRETSDVPVIMLTGRVEQEDKILGLDYGADDYVTKPFEPRELVARINSLIRRSQRLSKPREVTNKLVAGKLELNPMNFIAKYESVDLVLTTQEFEVLYCLMQNSGEVLSREKIMQSIHGEDWNAFDRALDIAISRIRKKLNKQQENNELIKTVWGKGYMFVDEV